MDVLPVKPERFIFWYLLSTHFLSLIFVVGMTFYNELAAIFLLPLITFQVQEWSQYYFLTEPSSIQHFQLQDNGVVVIYQGANRIHKMQIYSHIRFGQYLVCFLSPYDENYPIKRLENKGIVAWLEKVILVIKQSLSLNFKRIFFRQHIVISECTLGAKQFRKVVRKVLWD